MTALGARFATSYARKVVALVGYTLLVLLVLAMFEVFDLVAIAE